MEKVKQRLAEIANYVDKVKNTLLFAKEINDCFKTEVMLAEMINGITVRYFNFPLKQLPETLKTHGITLRI